MLLVQAGGSEAFAELYDQYAVNAYRVARSICRDHSRAEDAVQEAFLSLWRNRMNYSARVGTFKSWSMLAVRNRAIDSNRMTSRTKESRDELRADRLIDSASPAPDEEAIKSTERDDLLMFLSQLPEAQSEVIVLGFYGGLSHSEIAAELNLPAGTVKGRMRLGLEKLRERISAT